MLSGGKTFFLPLPDIFAGSTRFPCLFPLTGISYLGFLLSRQVTLLSRGIYGYASCFAPAHGGRSAGHRAHRSETRDRFEQPRGQYTRPCNGYGCMPARTLRALFGRMEQFGKLSPFLGAAVRRVRPGTRPPFPALPPARFHAGAHLRTLRRALTAPQ